MYRFAPCIFLFFISCTAPTRLISYTSRTLPIYAVDPPPQKIVLLNIYNIAEKKYRDNKEELFLQLIDTMMHWAATRIHDNAAIQTEVIRGYTAIVGNKDSVLSAIITAHNATHAIAVKSFTTEYRAMMQFFSGEKIIQPLFPGLHCDTISIISVGHYTGARGQ